MPRLRPGARTFIALLSLAWTLSAPGVCAAEPNPPHVAIVDVNVLSSLSNQGFSIGPLVARTATPVNNRELARQQPFKSIWPVLVADMKAVKKANKWSRVSAAMGRRLFDWTWLRASTMRFDLTGVFNRLDRRPFHTGDKTAACGEIRFIYRLAYTVKHGGEPMSGRLPMTLNVVFKVGDDGTWCQAVAKEWAAPTELKGPQLASWFVKNGALSASARKRWTLKAVETNLQSIRWQSTAHPTLAGHVEYLLRVFGVEKNGKARPSPLENTPDVDRLRTRPKLRQALLNWLRTPSSIAAADRGTLVVPSKYLAKIARSSSPLGMARRSNRPFTELFREKELAALPLAKTRSMKSPKAMLRRLDAASCMGCHQSKAVAGFHHLGEDPPDMLAPSKLFSGTSRHLHGDLKRRARYVAAVAAKRPTDEFRPFPERQGVTGLHAKCGLGDPGFADWTCAKGQTCLMVGDPDVGDCDDGKRGHGARCEHGRVVSKHIPVKDRVRGLKKTKCDQGYCAGNVIAFFGGMCGVQCNTPGRGQCSDFLDIDGFQKCLRRNKPYSRCAKRYIYRATFNDCDANNPCRDGYACAKDPYRKGVGVCWPAYFMYALRNDGYPHRK